MKKEHDFNISRLMAGLDEAIANGRTEEADALTDVLFHLQCGAESDAVMPWQFPEKVSVIRMEGTGGHRVKTKRMKKFITVAAAAAIVLALGVTAFATDLFGVRDFVIGGDGAVSEIGMAAGETESAGREADLIALQGYPDRNEYKASAEWNIFCSLYDTDGSVLSQVGNGSNEYTDRYPMYLVYSREMADKLEEIIAKYDLILHESMEIVDNPEGLYTAAGTGSFLKAGAQLGGYVYNDGSFHFDGTAVLENGAQIPYQFGNYVKGTFSSTYLNVGDAGAYEEWLYTTESGVTVSLALGEEKALLIADLNGSFVAVNILTGTEGNEGFGSGSIAAEDLEEFADQFDYSLIN